MVKVVALAGYKGGIGKTVLSFNLAERAHASGLRVLLWDFEDRRGYRNNTEFRRETYPDLPCWDLDNGLIGPEAVAVLRGRSLTKYDLVICDFPGVYSNMLGRLLSLMDLVMVPTSMSNEDRTVLTPMGDDALYYPEDDVIAEARPRPDPWVMVYVPNNMYRGRHWLETLRDDLTGLGYEVADASIVRRVDITNASLRGLGICEYAPDSAGASEMNGLWRWLVGRVDLGIPN